jgi:hypothetical protein
MPRRNWLVEDNLVALYVALHEYKELNYDLEQIKKIVPHAGFSMRIKNYRAIHTEGREGLDAALKSPLFNELYGIFASLDQHKFAKLANVILKVKSEITG